MSRAGRKRKAVQAREPNGREQRPTTERERTAAREDPRTVVIDQRVRFGVARDSATDQRAGYWLGRLAMARQLDSDEDMNNAMHRAGQLFATAWYRYQVMEGFAPYAPKAMDLNAIGGRPVRADPEAEDIMKLRRQLSDISCACVDMTGSRKAANFALHALKAVCIEDVDPRFWQSDAKHMWTGLLVGLRALVNHYGLMKRA